MKKGTRLPRPTHCRGKAKHPFTDNNILIEITPEGRIQWRCKKCRRISTKNYIFRRKNKRVKQPRKYHLGTNWFYWITEPWS